MKRAYGDGTGVPSYNGWGVEEEELSPQQSDERGDDEVKKVANRSNNAALQSSHYDLSEPWRPL